MNPALLRPDRRLLAMTAYGFVSGLPLPLSGFTLRLWLSEGGVSLAVVGLTAWIGLAYSLKFLWAPLLDQAPPLPALRAMGRRRGWLMLIQPALAIATVLLALADPAAPAMAFGAAVCVASLSATQDIAIDAWRIEVFPERRQGVALACYVWGYRIALLVATTGVIGSATLIGWHAALLGAAVLVAGGCAVTAFAPSEQAPADQAPDGQIPSGQIPSGQIPSGQIPASQATTHRSATGFRQAVIESVVSFLARPAAG